MLRRDKLIELVQERRLLEDLTDLNNTNHDYQN